MHNNAIVAQTAESFESLIVRFVPGRGVVADAFPLRIAISPEMLLQAVTHPGAITVQGTGGLGSRVTFTLANGEAIYEITDYAREVGTDLKLLVAERKSFKFKMNGKPAEIKRYGLGDLNKLADSGFPEIVAFYSDVLSPPKELKNIIRVRNKDTAPEVIINLAGARATYHVVMRHDALFVAERSNLRSQDGIIVRLPAAAAVGRHGMQIIS